MNLTERVHDMYEATSTAVKQAAVGVTYVALAAPVVMASTPAWGHPHQELTDGQVGDIQFVSTMHGLFYGVSGGVMGTLLAQEIEKRVKQKQYRRALLTFAAGAPAALVGSIITTYVIFKGVEFGARLIR